MRSKVSVVTPSILFASLLLIVVLGSFFFSNLWTISEKKDVPTAITMSDSMPLTEIAKKNNIPAGVITKALKISDADLNKNLSALNIEVNTAQDKVNAEISKMTQLVSANNTVSMLKLLGWLIFLIIVRFIIIRKKEVKPAQKFILYGISILLFGIVLGSKPSPLQIVKTFFVYLAEYHSIYFPALMLLVVFFSVFGVIIASRYICSFGCQMGTLQSFIFHLFKPKNDNKSFRQYKPPFWLSNTVRIVTFSLMLAFAILLSFDLVGYFNPFDVFDPAHLGIGAIIFTAIILLASIPVYRPFCYFFCPFGLVGWVFERLSINKIGVNFDKCTNCNECVEACPSTTMDAIMKKKAIVPDCFACTNCIGACAVDAVKWVGIKRSK
jgi:polyferredoxin